MENECDYLMLRGTALHARIVGPESGFDSHPCVATFPPPNTLQVSVAAGCGPNGGLELTPVLDPSWNATRAEPTAGLFGFADLITWQRVDDGECPGLWKLHLFHRGDAGDDPFRESNADGAPWRAFREFTPDDAARCPTLSVESADPRFDGVCTGFWPVELDLVE